MTPLTAPDETLRESSILIVDDQEANLLLLQRVLEIAGYGNLHFTTDPRQVSVMFPACRPDLIVLDLQMPHLDGFGVMEEVRTHQPEGSYLPILVMTADITPALKQRALSMGAKDFLNKPFDVTEALLRIRNLLETRLLHQQVRNQNEILEEKVRERTRELEEAQIEILERLASAAEFRDDDTGQHTRRVGMLSAKIAEEMGLPQEFVSLIRRASPLHDVGKIGIADRILLKPGRLTREEFEVMKNHSVIGAKILAGSRFQLLRMAEEIALTHHLRWDGSGYPSSLRGEDIPLSGRIVAVADFFDALTHDRPYKNAWPVSEALEEIRNQNGRQFDPAIVAAFFRVIHKGDRPSVQDVEAKLESEGQSV